MGGSGRSFVFIAAAAVDPEPIIPAPISERLLATEAAIRSSRGTPSAIMPKQKSHRTVRNFVDEGALRLGFWMHGWRQVGF